jgi:predicted nucleic acid-binding protein
LLEYLLGTAAGGAVAASLRHDDPDLHVPVLCDVEVVSGLRRGLHARVLAHQRALDAVQDYLDLPLTRHGHQVLLERMLELRGNFSAYDATYVALAERLAAGLLTADDRLARAARSHTDLRVLPDARA